MINRKEKIRMKRKSLFVSIMVLAIAMLTMISCGGPEFTGEILGDNEMNITAKNADTDSVILTGTLAVGEDEQITIDSNLENGSVQIEFISSEGYDNMEELPDMDNAEAKFTAYVSGVESQAVSFGGGEYMVRATVTEKATGTIDILVKGF